MADELGPAVAVLQRKLDEQLLAAADLKRTINMLLKASGKDPLYADADVERSGAVRADQFYGKPLAPSAAEYLAMRGQACQAEEIYRALKAGGFDFVIQGWRGDDRDMVRNLAMSLSKNTGSNGKFHRLKNGSFGLRAWYEEAFLKRAGDAPAKTKPKKAAGSKASKKSKPMATAKPAKVEKKAEKKKANGAKAATTSDAIKKQPKVVAAKAKSSVNEKNHPATEQMVQQEAS
jgi:hypothetical protein